MVEVMTAAIAAARHRIAAWRADPVLFVREAFAVEPDAWQAVVLRAFNTNARQAMKACKGPGKSAVLAWLAWLYLATRPHPKVVCTSITGDNLADGLWTEMAKWQNKSPFLLAAFQWSKTRIVARDHPETWWASARTWAKGADATQQADALAGIHSDYVLFIIDEAGGVPDAVAAAAEAGLANVIDPTKQEAHLLIAGNPTMLEGPLHRACTSERHLWHVTEITSDPDDPNRTPRVSVQWAREQIEKFGKDNPWVLVNVFGRFPPSSLNALLGPDEVSAAMRRCLPEEAYDWAAKVLGVDVARFGDDRTVLAPRQGLVAFQMAEMRGARSTEVAARAAKAEDEWGADAVMVDGTGGYGAGVIDNLVAGGRSPIEVQFGGKADDSRFANKRTEMWWDMAEWVKRGGCLPNDPELVRELTAPTYTFVGGKLALEPKDQIKARLGFSPDKADALACTFAVAVQPRPRDRNGRPVAHQVGRYITESDDE
jgi:hypothetical protein